MHKEYKVLLLKLVTGYWSFKKIEFGRIKFIKYKSESQFIFKVLEILTTLINA